MYSSQLEIERFLAPGLAMLERGHTAEGIDLITETLTQIRDNTGAQWQDAIKVIRTMKLFEISQLCPFTNHSFRKPRGYPGDAILLDWIYRDYRLLISPDPVSMSASLYRRTTSSPPATAVRWRRRHLANLIDDAAYEVRLPRILSVACGHLREADLSVALHRGLVGNLVALDQDEESLKEVDHRYTARGIPIETVTATILDILVGRYKVEDFDLIYSAGLYDYLDERVARKLTNMLFAGIKPGGRLILSNFLKETPDLGWTEAIMDWFLIYRDMSQIKAFAVDIPSDQIASAHTYLCPTRCIGYLSLRKQARVGGA